MQDNDGRKPVGWLPEVRIEGAPNAVFQVVEESSGDVLYTIRSPGATFEASVYAEGTYTLKIGTGFPDVEVLTGLKPAAKGAQKVMPVKLSNSS